MARTGRRRTPAFTLMELLVVITIILLVSAVTLPAVLPALSHRQVSEAARILQGALVQARDTAIRFNAPRGMRFLPDPTYANTPGVLAYNRMVPIEPAPEYSNGMVTIWPVPNPSNTTNPPNTANVSVPNPSAYPIVTPNTSGAVYPYYPTNFAPSLNPSAGKCLMVEQAPFANNNAAAPPTSYVNAPTSWFWNIRVGDKIQINNTGATYTIVGPCAINPNTSSGANPELFVNVGQPGDTTNYLARQYTDALGNPTVISVEYLYLVNGIDDMGLGYVDSGWDGIVNWAMGYGTAPMPTAAADMVADNLYDWQSEAWQGALANFGMLDATNTNYNTALTNSVSATTASKALLPPATYTITRRPVPSPSARETSLPNGVVIDATTWNLTSERSRLPVDPFSGYADILLLPSGQVVPTTLYSSPTSFTLGDSFYHFWIAERGDVYAPTNLWGSTKPPTGGPQFLLPMPQDAYTAFGTSNFTTQPPIALQGERMLVTLFSRTGQITANSIEFFNCGDINTPFYDSQLGAREAK